MKQKFLHICLLLWDSINNYFNSRYNIWFGISLGFNQSNLIRKRFNKYHNIINNIQVLRDNKVNDFNRAGNGNLWYDNNSRNIVKNLTNYEINRISKFGASFFCKVKCCCSSFIQNIYIKNVFAVILFFLFIISANAQYRFEHLTTKDGLSSNRIRCTFRDSKGYLWIGSEIGLDKYDSYQIKTYRYNEKQSGTISCNNIVTIFEDRNKNLWVGTMDGLNLYFPEDDSFQVFRNNPNDIHSIDKNRIHAAIFEDTKGNLWIPTSGNCLNKWDPAAKQFIRYPIKNSKGYSVVKEDSKGNLLLVTEGLPGIYRFNPDTGNLTAIDGTINLGRGLKRMYIDENDKIWITNNEGLVSFDQSTGKFKQFGSNGDGKGTNGKLIYNIIKEDDRHLLFGVDQGGINRFDQVSGTFEYIMHNEYDEDGLSNNGIWGLYRDQEGIIWISTSGGGINIYNPKKEKFKLYRHNINNPNSVSSNIIGCFHEDSQGMIWIGTDNSGLDVLNPRTGSFKHFKTDLNNPYSISSNTIRCVAEDENNDLWIGTWNSGLNRFNRKTGKFTCYLPDSANLASLSGSSIWHCIIDHKGIFWLAIHNVGVDLFDKNKGVIKRFVPNSKDSKALSNAKVWYIFEDSNRNIWLCTNDGLDLYDSISNSFTVYKHLPSKNIKAIAEDQDKNLWLGTEKGICQIKADGTILQAYDETNGLPGDIIHGIVCDNNGNIWVSTNNGVSRFNPKTKEFRNFTDEDGLQDNSFFQESFLKTSEGEIYFGGFKGFNAFFPDSIKVNKTIPPVYITEFQIFNKPVPFGIKGSPLQKQISETKEITLTYLQSVFSFGFTAINYTNPEKNKYAYKMEGFEKDWNYTDAARRYVTYTNLDPGEYTFRVKASNNDGIWNEKGTSIRIIITPPFWEAWWFRIIAICAILFSVIGFFNYRTNKLKRQKTLLTDMVKERTFQLQEANAVLEEKQEEIYMQNEELQSQKEALQEVNRTLGKQAEEIEDQKNELDKHRNYLEQLVKERTADLAAAMKRVEESDRLKSAFLSNMSHEIRTPMNAIVGFSSLLNESDISDKEKKELISYITKNSESLLVLIDDILEMAKIQANQIAINNQPVNITEILKELLASFLLQAEPKGIELIIDTGIYKDNFICSTDPIRLKQVLSNLISNAIKFTEKGIVKFGISDQNNEFVTFYVKDTGIGIPKETGDSIFERFLKVESTMTKFYKGVGLGLSICYSLVKTMGGNIWYESTVGKGTSFYFTIPYNEKENITITQKTKEIKKREIPNLEDKKILIVEDDETNYKLLVFYLAKTKAKLTWAKNGLEALDHFKHNGNFDLILMDLKLPVMDGIEATRLIRQINPDQVIVAQTAFVYKEEKIEFLKCKFNGYLDKPINIEKLIEILNGLFNLWN